jgi:hypothetical protein
LIIFFRWCCRGMLVLCLYLACKYFLANIDGAFLVARWL